jgi:hypothetical protein
LEAGGDPGAEALTEQRGRLRRPRVHAVPASSRGTGMRTLAERADRMALPTPQPRRIPAHPLVHIHHPVTLSFYTASILANPLPAMHPAKFQTGTNILGAFGIGFGVGFGVRSDIQTRPPLYRQSDREQLQR